AILFKIADRMEQNLELLATAETRDKGKPIPETSASDQPLAMDHVRYFPHSLPRPRMRVSEGDRQMRALPCEILRGRVGYSCTVAHSGSSVSVGGGRGGGGG
ncbi:aldehyde dehydrogenase family protein, partial [Escherichia coli]|uniref:aldehyde dehydrogenase family protein n=1 Tax=Escherichia coli TaxID=562 RepID=UPI0010CB1E98